MSWNAAPLIARLGLLLGLLALLFLVLTQPPLPSRPPVPFTAPLQPIVDLTDPPSRDPTPHDAILDRPVFAPSRRPWVPPPPPPNQAETVSSLEGYVVIGIIITDNARRGLVRPPHGGNTIFLSEGERLAGWQLREIHPRGLRFSADGASFEMNFHNRSDTSP